jgi:peptidylprolyl isomerase
LLSATLVLSVGLLSACSGGSANGSPSPSDSTSASASDSASAPTATTASAADVAALAAVTVSGDLGSAPTATFTQPFSVGAIVARLDTKGSGTDSIAADSYVQVNYSVFSGDDGSQLASTWNGQHSEVIPMTGLSAAFDPLVKILVGSPVGTRVVLGIPPSPATETTAASPAEVMVLEADRIVPTHATGTAVTPPAGLPTVTLAANGEPSITVPADATKPTDLVAQTLIKGDGPAVAANDVITVQYSGWLWDGTAFDSSWTNGTPFQTQIGTSSVIQGWDKGLIGQTVGSQVLLVIPPSLGYGDQESGTIPANSTLIFVVDILAAG